MFLCYKDSDQNTSFVNLSLARGIYLWRRKNHPLLSVVFNDDDSISVEIKEDSEEEVMQNIFACIRDKYSMIDVRAFQP